MDIGWDWAYVVTILPTLGSAFLITLYATLTGFVVALIVGLIFAMLRSSHFRIIKWPTVLIIEFIRATPLLVKLYFLYFVLPDWGILLNAFLVGTIGLGLHYSTYVSEVIRSGLEHVPKGQREAAVSLNLNWVRTFKDVILPQAIPPIIPALGNYLIAMLKDSPLLSAVTVVEILQQAKILGSENFKYLEPLTLVGVAFLIASLASAWAIQKLELSLPKHGIRMR